MFENYLLQIMLKARVQIAVIKFQTCSNSSMNRVEQNIQ